MKDKYFRKRINMQNEDKYELTSTELYLIKKIEVDILKEFDRICRKHNIKYSLAFGTMIGAIRHKGFIPWDDDIDVFLRREDYNKFLRVYSSEMDCRFFLQNHTTDSEYYVIYDKIRANNTIFKERFFSKYNIHHGVFMDVFIVDNVPDNKFERWIHSKIHQFYRVGIQIKYWDNTFRTGKKKIYASILKYFYLPFSLRWLYKKDLKWMRKYNDVVTGEVRDMFEAGGYVYKREYFEEYMDCPFEDMTAMISKYYDRILRMQYGDYMKLPPKEQQIAHHFVHELNVDSYNFA